MNTIRDSVIDAIANRLTHLGFTEGGISAIYERSKSIADDVFRALRISEKKQDKLDKTR